MEYISNILLRDACCEIFELRRKNSVDVGAFVPSIREKLRELNNELLKKNAFIDEMEPKYNTSCEFGF